MKTLLKKGQKFTFYAKREYSLFQVYSFIPCFVRIIRSLLNKETTARFESKDNWMSLYLLREHIDSFIHYYVDLIENKEPFLEKEIEELNRTGNAWVEGAKKNAELSQEPNADLQKLLQSFWDLLDVHATSLWKTFVIPEAGNIVFTKLLSKHVPPHLHSKATAIYSQPSKKAHLLRLSEALSQRPNLNERVNYVKENFPWIFTTDLFSPLPNEEQYVEYARTFKAPVHEKNNENILPDEVMPIVSVCQDISYVKDHRDEFRRKAFFYIQPLVEKIIESLNVTREDLWHVLPEEISKLENTREEMLKIIKLRKQGFVFETNEKEFFILQGKKAEDNFVKEEEELEGDEIKGIVGSPGKIQGEAQVIKSSQMCRNFKEGNILIATTTNPDYVSAMQKALAFVTDEGGITCHAAILARELKKPCIVGTKVATKVLKDGDLVEVDAERGIITILEKYRES